MKAVDLMSVMVVRGDSSSCCGDGYMSVIFVVVLLSSSTRNHDKSKCCEY